MILMKIIVKCYWMICYLRHWLSCCLGQVDLMIHIWESGYEASKQLCLLYRLSSSGSQMNVKSVLWCQFEIVVLLCAAERNYLLREMSRVVPAGCPELQKGIKWSCKNWVRLERSLILIEGLEARASRKFYSADLALEMVKILCHNNSSFIAVFGVSGSSKLCCSGRPLLHYLP